MSNFEKGVRRKADLISFNLSYVKGSCFVEAGVEGVKGVSQVDDKKMNVHAFFMITILKEQRF